MATRNINTFDEFKEELKNDTELQEEFKANPVAAIDTFQQKSPLETDKWIYRIVVLALGSTILAIIIGVIVLVGTGDIQGDIGVPTILTAIGSAAIGALAGLLAPSPKGA
jgi:hypothetical protein